MPKPKRTEWLPGTSPPKDDRRVIVQMSKRYTQDGESGIRFGWYIHSIDEWRIDGSPSKWNDHIRCWIDIPKPPKEEESPW